MSDIMTPIPFPQLMNRLIEERKKGSCFGMRKSYKADPSKYFSLFGRKLETQIGPAAGPNTQLAQNIIASYYGGARFFELKTVQKIDGRELAAAVHKPCILAEDECYNCEWSTELTVSQAYEEYVKAWLALKVISKEWELGSPDGFQFNISVGYDLEGIKGEKVNTFIDSMINAEGTAIFRECKSWLKSNLHMFTRVTESDIDAITPDIINSATVSTLHGCPPQEIEAIATYLITQKGLHTFIKCNPTLLGYDEARKTLDDMGYDYIQFTDIHFKGDLQYSDAVPMLGRLQKLCGDKGLQFGVKITNTFPVDVKNNELPSEEMYMSGKSLYPLSLRVARNLSRSFGGKLRISFSGGCDFFNIKKVVDAGIWPVTMATTLLKPGGYTRLIQIAETLSDSPKEWDGINVHALENLAEDAKKDPHHVKPIKPLPHRKSEKKVPLLDCFTAPCSDRCPIHQDITLYGKLTAEGKYAEALRVILAKNPLPFITGNICTHTCQTACTRNHYESPVQIRSNKLIAARNGYDTVISEIKPGKPNGKRVAIIGAGPAGIAAAFFLSREGTEVTVYDENDKAGGVISNIIPSFRISDDEIRRDVSLAESAGAKFILGKRVSLKEFYGHVDAVILAVGAHKNTPLTLTKGTAINALKFLEEFKDSDGKMNLGENVVIVGGGNTAMDTARAAKRTEGVKNVYLVYRRTRRYMPADEEELDDALKDGVIFCELLSPVSVDGGKLLCRKMILSDPDEKGRRSVKETDATTEIPCDTLIASIGEKVASDFYRSEGIAVNEKGMPALNPDTCETSIPGVYAIGDGAFGASVVVKAIADAQRACESILGRELFTVRKPDTSICEIYCKKGILEDAPESLTADSRCLTCDKVCENCTEVCPNRANVAIEIPGHDMHQIIHVDYMCNECGNCSVFCPYDSSPYKDKFTLFANADDMKDSGNDGFTFTGHDGEAVVRFEGRESKYTVGKNDGGLDSRIAELIDTVYRDYAYLILR